MPVLMISGHADVADRRRSHPPRRLSTSSRSRCSASGCCVSLRNAVEALATADRREPSACGTEQERATSARAPAMRRLRETVEKAAPTPATVLITGESGTGKELVARAIHRLSARRERVIVQVNCAAIPEDLIESELFGHEKGSFTGAVRKPDRASSSPPTAAPSSSTRWETCPPARRQRSCACSRTGRWSPWGPSARSTVDVRVVAATNRSLEDEIAAGRFREDLFYRLNVIPIRTPALREHLEDISGARRATSCAATPTRTTTRPKEFQRRGPGAPQGAALEGERPRAQEPRRAPAHPLARR